MSKQQEEIIKILKSISENNKVLTEPAKVQSVNEDKHSCVVTIDGYDIEDVRLGAVIDNNENISFIVPVIGSWVLVSYVLGSETDAYVSAFSEVEKIKTKANSLNAEITDIILTGVDSFVINNGDNAGLVKVIGLTDKLNNIESDINDLKNALNSWVAIPNDGGAALKAASASWAARQLTQTNKADIENDKIKH
ncbi:MAG: hypothetical protein B6I20_05545 [Bacteroidetes bacterium 4572_117]|nr:MAG: hypothetical protein B6I20_05545 [Bacteroidetes bacterium 4572_117]